MFCKAMDNGDISCFCFVFQLFLLNKCYLRNRQKWIHKYMNKGIKHCFASLTFKIAIHILF